MSTFNLVASRAIRKHAHARPFTLVQDGKTAWGFKYWFNKHNGKFVGKYPEAMAISHAQVCKSPVQMFVVKEDMVGRKRKDTYFTCVECGGTAETRPAACPSKKCGSTNFVRHSQVMTRENYFFPSQVIVNAEIIEMLPTVLREIRKRRSGIFGWLKPRKKKWVAINNVFPMTDACMSFPMEDEKQVLRANVIKVRYQTISNMGLKTHEETIVGMKSHIFQHEIDHQHCIDIHQSKQVTKLKFKEDNGKEKTKTKKESIKKKKASSKRKLSYSGTGRKEDCARCKRMPKGKQVKGHNHRNYRVAERKEWNAL